jgi:hypothetical protein
MWSRNERPKAVPLDLGFPAHFQRFGSRAAIPIAYIHDTGKLRTIEIRAPGAQASNTEVRWDGEAQRLYVGVWCGRSPIPGQALKFPVPELIWSRSFYLPQHQGQLARARISRGVLTIQIPSEPSTPPASNVIPLPQRHQVVASDPNALAAGCRRLGAALCVALCLPLLMFALLLFGFLVVPLLPFIGASIAVALGKDATPPPVRPNMPAAPAAAPAFEQARAA